MKTKLGNESFIKEENLTTTIINMYPALKRYCQFLTKNGWDAEDLAHEAIEKMYNKYINEKANPNKITHALLYRIAHNQWVDQIRKRSKENGVANTEPSIDPMKLLPEIYTISELLVEHLTPQQTVIFILKDVFQYGLSDIAKQLNLSEGAVKASLFRTRHHLRKLMDEESMEPHIDARNIEIDQSRVLCESIIQSIQQDQPFILIKQYKKLFHQQLPMCKGQFNLHLQAAA